MPTKRGIVISFLIGAALAALFLATAATHPRLSPVSSCGFSCTEAELVR